MASFLAHSGVSSLRSTIMASRPSAFSCRLNIRPRLPRSPPNPALVMPGIWSGPIRMAAGASQLFPEGQDMGEMFDVCEAPAQLGAVEKVVMTGRTKNRKAVHTDGDWHRAVHVWLSNGKGSVLLQRRSEYKDTFPNRWDVSCAGHVGAGCSSIETALRELEEELGLTQVKASDLVFVGTLACSIKGSTQRHGAFQCNEFQDLYILPVPDLEQAEYRFQEGEVAGIKVEDAMTLLGKLAQQDPDYVPRGPDYRKALQDRLQSMK